VERERKIKRAKEREKKKRGETFPAVRSLYFSLALHYLNAWNRLPVAGGGERSQRGLAHSLVKNAVSGLQTTYLKEKNCRICVQVLLIFLPRLHNPKTSLQPSLIYHMGSPQDLTLT